MHLHPTRIFFLADADVRGFPRRRADLTAGRDKIPGRLKLILDQSYSEEVPLKAAPSREFILTSNAHRPEVARLQHA